MPAMPISKCESLDEVVKAQEAERAFAMDEASFRAFYAQTARPLWAYLARASGDQTLAEDLLQETYYRFLRARPDPMNDAPPVTNTFFVDHGNPMRIPFLYL